MNSSQITVHPPSTSHSQGRGQMSGVGLGSEIHNGVQPPGTRRQSAPPHPTRACHPTRGESGVKVPAVPPSGALHTAGRACA